MSGPATTSMDNEDIEFNYFRENLYNGINLAFLDCAVDTSRDVKPRGTILLLHGFPQTSYQWRSVIPSLTKQGFRVIAPDYRGAGESSKPNNGFTKASMAADVIALLDCKKITERVHVVGHDIGGIIAFTIASRWPDRVASLCVSEFLLPGTATFAEECNQNPVAYFHLTFHRIENLPEALISGREKTYIEYFVSHLCYRLGAFPANSVQRYANSYAQPGALRCALDLFRSFEKDEEDLVQWLSDHGKCRIPTLVLSGQHSSYNKFAESMMLEVLDERCVRAENVESAGHFVAEENPHDFVRKLMGFIQERIERR